MRELGTDLYNDENIVEIIRQTIKETVNGKIDRIEKKLDEHNAKHEEDMREIRPVIKEFKERQIRDAFLLQTGERIKWTGGVLLALAALYTIIKGALRL